MGYLMGFHLTRQPDGAWLGVVPGLGDPDVQRQVEERRRLLLERTNTLPTFRVRLMDLLRSGLDRPRGR